MKNTDVMNVAGGEIVLYQPAISKHLSNIFNEGELEKESVNSILEYTAADGKTYKVQYYNLDAIISVETQDAK